jgi:carbon-monoxide dehydrogenase medium subunit
MKPAPFHYYRADSALAAVQAAAAPDWNGNARFLAGGQSLVPALSFRDIRPAVLVDIMHCPDLGRLDLADHGLVAGARCVQSEIECSVASRAVCPLLVDALRWVALPQIRNCGTVVGSLAQANPGAEIPVVAMALNATIEIMDVEGRRETIDAGKLFANQSGTFVGPAQLLTSAYLRALRHNEGWGFAEIQLRPGHYALVCAATAVVVSEGRVAETSISVGGLNSNPYRAASAEAFTLGRDILTDTWITEAARIAVDGSPWAARADQHASAEYRQAMAIIVVRDALRSAARRAQFAPRKGHG